MQVLFHMEIPSSLFIHASHVDVYVEIMDQQGAKTWSKQDLESGSKTHVINKSKGEFDWCKGLRREKTGTWERRMGCGRLNQC